MLEARHYGADATAKGSYALPAEFDGVVNEGALYHAVRAYRNNQRQGNASTKTKAEVSGGGRKPWRQKGTGRARQGSIRAPQWAGGGVVFGPRPRSYRTDLPRRVRQVARHSALNARARDGGVLVVEPLEFDAPKTKRLVALLEGMGVAGRHVLILTAEHRPAVYLSGRNVPDVHVMRYADASAYELLWAEAVVIEEAAIGGHHVEGSETRTRRARKAASARTKAARKKPAARKKTTRKKAVRKKSTKKKGAGDA